VTEHEAGAEGGDRPADGGEAEEAERGFGGAPVTAALFASMIGAFAAQIFLSGHLRFALGVPEHVLRWLGANASLWTIADTRLETLVTSCFLHASVLHLALNLLPLYQVGRLVERSIGPARYFPLFLVTGIIGSATSAIWGRFFGQTLSVGASGAICGLIGAAIVIGVRTEGWKSELAIRMTLWLAILLLIPLARYLRGDFVQIDNAAHVGGAIAGVMVAATWRKGHEYSAGAARRILTVCVALIVLSGATVYVRDRSDPYLFLDVEGRMRAALDALRAGRCDRARLAMSRAVQMDPKNRAIRALSEEIDRECGGARRP
jgi:rhomboid protease GluP